MAETKEKITEYIKSNQEKFQASNVSLDIIRDGIDWNLYIVIKPFNKENGVDKESELEDGQVEIQIKDNKI